MEPGERIRKSFGRRLRRFRESADLSAETLASRLDVHPNTVWKLERGEQWIGADLLERIEGEMKWDVSRLLTDAEPQMTPQEALDVLRRAIEAPSPLPASWRGILDDFPAINEFEAKFLRDALAGLRNQGGDQARDASARPRKSR